MLYNSPFIKKVGVAGFEPATSCSQSRRDKPGYATPRGVYLKNICGEGGIRTLGTVSSTTV